MTVKDCLFHSAIKIYRRNGMEYLHHMSDYSQHLNDKPFSSICPDHKQQMVF